MPSLKYPRCWYCVAALHGVISQKHFIREERTHTEQSYMSHIKNNIYVTYLSWITYMSTYMSKNIWCIYVYICVIYMVTYMTYMKLGHFIYVVMYESYMTHICHLYVVIYVKIYDFYMALVCHICDMHLTCMTTYMYTYMQHIWITYSDIYSADVPLRTYTLTHWLVLPVIFKIFLPGNFCSHWMPLLSTALHRLLSVGALYMKYSHIGLSHLRPHAGFYVHFHCSGILLYINRISVRNDHTIQQV